MHTDECLLVRCLGARIGSTGPVHRRWEQSLAECRRIADDLPVRPAGMQRQVPRCSGQPTNGSAKVRYRRKQPLASDSRLVPPNLLPMSVYRQHADVGAAGRRRRPVLRPTLAGGRRRLQSAAASSSLCPATMGGDRESGLRPRTTTPLCNAGVACHVFACHPGVGAGGLGYGRRHHSRCPRPAHEQTVLMAQRV